jgi:hypothetical protein
LPKFFPLKKIAGYLSYIMTAVIIMSSNTIFNNSNERGRKSFPSHKASFVRCVLYVSLLWTMSGLAVLANIPMDTPREWQYFGISERYLRNQPRHRQLIYSMRASDNLFTAKHFEKLCFSLFLEIFTPNVFISRKITITSWCRLVTRLTSSG